MDIFKNARGNWDVEYYWHLRRKHKDRRVARRRLKRDTRKEAQEARND